MTNDPKIPSQRVREIVALLAEWQIGTEWTPSFFHLGFPKGVREGAWDNHDMVQMLASFEQDILQSSGAVEALEPDILAGEIMCRLAKIGDVTSFTGGANSVSRMRSAIWLAIYAALTKSGDAR